MSEVTYTAIGCEMFVLILSYGLGDYGITLCPTLLSIHPYGPWYNIQNYIFWLGLENTVISLRLVGARYGFKDNFMS